VGKRKERRETRIEKVDFRGKARRAGTVHIEPL